jgi:hypothetical protein
MGVHLPRRAILKTVRREEAPRQITGVTASAVASSERGGFGNPQAR